MSCWDLEIVFLWSCNCQTWSSFLVVQFKRGSSSVYKNDDIGFCRFLTHFWLTDGLSWPLSVCWWPLNVSWLEQKCDKTVTIVTFLLVLISECFLERKHFMKIKCDIKLAKAIVMTATAAVAGGSGTLSASTAPPACNLQFHAEPKPRVSHTCLKLIE